MRRKTVWVWTAAALLLGGGLAAWRLWPATVAVAPVQRGPAVEAVYATGVVEPTVQMPVAPRSGGRLLSWEVAEGASVKRGQVLARLEAGDLEQTVQELSARTRLARANFERTQTLVAEKFLSQAELDRTRIELEAQQAALRRAEAQRDYSLLLAPADGVVMRRDGERGQFIAAGQTVYTLACCAPLRVAAEVDEEDIARVRLGMPVVMRSEALPKRLIDGEVAEITPKGDPVARSYRVRIKFKDEQAFDLLGQGGLRSGMTMDANLIVGQREQALLVPSRALSGNVLWVLADGRVHKREVQLGVKGTERSEVLQGVKEGEQVLVSPAAELRDGQRANPASP